MNRNILCLAPRTDDAEALAARLAGLPEGGRIGITAGFPEDPAERSRAPLAIIAAAVPDDALALLDSIRERAGHTATRTILIGTPAGDDETRTGRFDTTLPPDAPDDALGVAVRDQLTRFVIAHAPNELPDFDGWLDLGMVAGALASARDSVIKLSGRYEAVEDSVLGSPEMPDEQLEGAMIGEIDRLLGHPPRTTLAPGDMITREGDTATGIWIILEGQVELYRIVDGEDIVFHSESAGRIVGLMALYRRSPIFYSCRARTACTLMRLSHEEVRQAIHESAEFAGHLIGVILRSMARRNRRAAQLLIKNRTLNRQLAERKSDLEQTLDDLREAQERLVESEKMSTLGTIAAGLAHELNNPVAAILRAADHLAEDLVPLLRESAELQSAAAALVHSVQRQPLSTAEERTARNALAGALRGDRQLAADLFGAGVRGPGELDALLAEAHRIPRDKAVASIIRGGHIGGSLRNLNTCARRISKLVRSLKVYARDDQDWQRGIDLNHTLEDVVTLLANHLRDIDLHKDYGTLPPITCMPSQLEQVWTNLMINATQAMDGKGALFIHTRHRESDGLVEVAIEDHGPGIPPDVQPRLFRSRFTTRAGRIEFGLGLGLPISKTLIANHGGSISFESRPGLTRFTILLPLQPPETNP